jgi:alkylation response protein AidB-like acyl-CoA dehydrogenase
MVQRPSLPPNPATLRADALALADRLAGEFAPAAAAYDRAGEFPIAHIERTKSTGYTLLTLPAELVGQLSRT